MKMVQADQHLAEHLPDAVVLADHLPALVALDRIRAGAVVGVFGCGPIGLLIAQLARVSGATTIVATDVLPHRVEVLPK